MAPLELLRKAGIEGVGFLQEGVWVLARALMDCEVSELDRCRGVRTQL